MSDKKHLAKVTFATLMNAMAQGQVKLSWCTINGGNVVPVITMFDDKGDVNVAAMLPPDFHKLIQPSEDEPEVSIDEAKAYLLASIAEKNNQSN